MNSPIQSTAPPALMALLRPRSVAVIGASEQPGNLGGVAISLMKKFGFAGDLWPVNPRRASVHGLVCHNSVRDLPAGVDLAIIATGVEMNAGIVRECAEAGIRHGIVWAGGYAETGEQGAKLQDALLDVCRQTGFTLVGPNCIGIINARTGMVASFASFLVEAPRLLAGNIAMVSQSGGLATTVQALAQQRGIGFSITISGGNEAMLTIADYIHALASDEDTKVIAVYLEGVRDGDKFTAAVRAARAAGKPVVVLKGGLSAVSAQAALAHTGALAGTRRVWEAVAAELGIICVSSLEELLDVVSFLSRADLGRLPRGNGVAVVSFGGGSGVLAADQCAAHGLELPALTAATRARLSGLVTPIAAINNPIDLTPQTFNQEQWFAGFPEALQAIADDPGIDVIMCQFGPMAQRGVETAKVMSELRHRTQKTVCLAWVLPPSGVYEALEAEGMFVFKDYERATSTLARLIAPEVSAPGPVAQPGFDWSGRLPDVRAGTVISEDACHRILQEAGLATARGRLARNEAEAVQMADALGFPLVAKGISAAVTHRAAAGLIALDLRTAAQVREAYGRLRRKAGSQGIALEGVYLQEMIGRGLEIIVSALRDPVFGTVVSCGSGGNLTELIDDVALGRTPLDVAGAAALLRRTRIVEAAGKLEPEARLDDLARFVADFSQLAHAVPWRKFILEVNPVKWSAAGVVAVDGLLIIEEP